MLLYRVGDYKYHRLFFPVPYEEIKPFIWNEQTNYFADELGIKSLIEIQKKLVDYTSPPSKNYKM
ncbi:hypothetical protein [Psychrobacter sp. WY6]|uniref:hypothetical protein n=1 Tax=Psychrobacter sp. WY6 TaxID=2708350 RepID=UPI0020231269|nr:hypothetical protein [Psychrobacter sp. WY6]